MSGERKNTREKHTKMKVSNICPNSVMFGKMRLWATTVSNFFNAPLSI